MKIVCTVTNDLSHDQRMHRICTTLAAAGHSVTLVGRWLPDSPPLPDRPYRQHRIRCRYRRGKRFYLEYNWRLWRTLRGWDFDYLNSVDLDTLPAGYLLDRPHWVYDAHEWFSETPEVVGRPLVRRAWQLLGRWLVPKTTARYTVAEILSEKLSDEYGCSFGVVRSLPVRRPVPDRPPPAEKILLYQGMLNPGRGLDVAVAALAGLPDCRLWLVGSGPEEAGLRELADRLGVGDRVTFHGFQPPDRLPAYTRAAWLGLNLLDAVSPSYYYSLANKSLDYVQDGLPSVQMDFPEYRAINDRHDCYLILHKLAPAPLARLIESVDETRYGELRRNCARAAEVLCWEREGERLLGYFPLPRPLSEGEG